MDEVFALQVTRHPLPELVELASVDLSPPLFYLALRAWLRAGGALGLAPSLALARGLNFTVWLGLVVGLAWIASRLRHRVPPALLVLATVGSAHALQWAHELRTYGFAFAGVTVAFALLAADLAPGPGRAGLGSGGWTAYAMAAVVALGSHALAAPLLALGGLAWLLVRSLRKLPVTGGIVAHAAAAAAGLPWLLRTAGAAGRLRTARPEWMTPPDLGNLLRVFVEWLPYGRNGWPAGGPRWSWALLGALTFAPLAMLLVSRCRRRDVRPGADPLSMPAFAGAGITLAFVLALWLAHRAGWVFAFHGPRYPALAAGIWAASLVLAAAAVTARRGSAWLLLLPWLATSAIGTARAVRAEATGGLLAAKRVVAELADGAPVFYTPTGLGSYFRGTLGALGARPVEGLPCALATPGAAAAILVELNRWREVDFPRELQLTAAMAQGLLAVETARPLTPTGDYYARRITAAGSDPALLARWCDDGIALAPRPELEGAAVAAPPEAQRASRGWSYLEFDRALVPYRWTAREPAELAFSAPLPRGPVTLRLLGYREPRPERTVALELAGCGGWRTALELGPGFIDRAVELPAACGGRRSLRIAHPLWEAPAGDETAPRRLGIQLRGAVVTAR